nr:uncharacterized ENTR1 family protein-like [Aedes albopictus]XP_029712765.1 uncharacterized ENTR1 family protein-like [Aedes albopictus]XP_029712774.1 uncharacterized ENTR1 family protein-like [Aedes albopictus]XP_029712777.1 uncharacterized ENTR1 family protein-like [Aedes albopictus]XP_029712783.1 uncharacterized ENTR1 family protein-like [Aedes albopictus]XP_029712788.1 uncharacterized ENTR1 family protein-like [Aedes albopictus]XP_029712794.1 uncharacterized ENTR1 family protein-like [A
MSYGAGYATTGRTASTSSIYDYPEHLNPFYEDENHKRLRFWNFGSMRRDKPRSERRGSLVSLRDGLRNMWTFRPMKKRSSSLGINKTSESPPPLRRDDPDVHYHTYNSSMASGYRNTLNSTVSGYHHPGHSQSTSNTPLFPRNSRERSSLQSGTIGMNNDIGFNRNDRYRCTFANGSATYGGGTMFTSTPRSRYGVQPQRGMSNGVSQASLKSSNPFDDEGIDDSISLNDSVNGANGTLQRRKKRRAPPPPVRNIANISVDPSDTVLATRLRIEETPPVENQEGVKNLSNLTAEIESFVRSSSDDKVNQEKPEPTNRIEEPIPPSDSNNNHVQELVIVERKTEVVEEVSPTHKNAEERLELRVEVKEVTPEERTSGNTDIPEPVEQMSQLESLKLEEEPRPPITPPHPIPRAKPTPPPIPQTPPVVEPVDLENVALPETPIPARRLNKNRNQVPANSTELRITESSDSATTSTAEEEENMEFRAAKPINYEFKYKVEPIKTEIDEKINTARLKISESTGDIESLQNSGTERRRSVRDIIESINKSQSLLKFNQESSGTLYSAQSNDSVNRNLRQLNDSEKEIQRMLHEMETKYTGNGQTQPRKWSLTPPMTNRSSYYDNVPEGDENLDNLDDRNNLLSKSALRSKKSPTKSLGIEQTDNAQFQDCIDWNPLPKPRRSRHFADTQVNQSTSGTGDVLTVIDQNNNSNGKQS